MQNGEEKSSAEQSRQEHFDFHDQSLFATDRSEMDLVGTILAEHLPSATAVLLVFILHAPA